MHLPPTRYIRLLIDYTKKKIFLETASIEMLPSVTQSKKLSYKYFEHMKRYLFKQKRNGGF